MTKRAAIYSRVSLDRDGTKASIQTQENEGRALSQANGWAISVYADRDLSAFKAGVVRPAFDQMMADVDAGLIDVVVVYKLDRLTRGGISGIAPILDRLKKANAQLVSVHDNIDTSTPVGEGVVGLLASFAKQESVNTSVRVSSAHQRAVREGRAHSGGHRCFGYERDGSIVVSEATALREVAARFLTGESLRQLARYLNTEGILTTAGHEWSPSVLGHTLRSPKLRGYRTHQGVLYQGDWEPIFTESEHLELLAVLNDSRRLSVRRSAYRYLMTGTVVCAECGGPMKYNVLTNRNGKRFARYQCTPQPGYANCGKTSASMVSADTIVTTKLLAFLSMGNADQQASEAERAALVTMLDADRDAVESLTRERYFDRTVDEHAYITTRKLLEERIASTEAKLSQLASTGSLQLPTTLPELHAWWDGADIAERRTVLSRYIRQVRVHPAKHRGGNQFDPDRIEILWRG